MTTSTLPHHPPSPSASSSSASSPSTLRPGEHYISPLPSPSPVTRSSSLRSTIELCLANLDRPVHVILVVYDLLPPGNLSNLAWLFGVGLYHTAVKIPAIGREIAFGGHPHSQLSGIFSLPIRDDGLPIMAGLRWICEIDMGNIKPVQAHNQNLISFRSSFFFKSSRNDLDQDEEDHDHHYNLDDRDQTSRLIRLPPSAAKPNKSIKFQPSSSSDIPDHSYPPTPKSSLLPPFSPPSSINHSTSSYASSSKSSDSTKSLLSTSLSSSPTEMETLAFILDQLDRCPDWHGTSYDLLHRNCNTFSDQFCMLLTGQHAPKWINRAAAVGSALPCLVPTDWIEPPPALIDETEKKYEENGEEYDRQLESSAYRSPRSPMRIQSMVH